MIPGGFRKEIVPAGFSAEAQSKVVMTEKTEFSATVCTAVVQLDHGIPVWSLVRRGDSRRAAIDFAYLSYKWGTAHYREISAELIFCNPRSPPAALVRIEVWSRWVRFPKLCLWPEVADFTLSSRDFPNEIFGFGQFALFAKTPLLLRAIADAAVQLVALLLITIINNRVEGARAVPIDGSAVLWLRLQLESDAQSGSHRLR